MIKVLPVVLCGGAGTRLWPLSRMGFPKQFLSLTGDGSLFQQTVRRLFGLSATELLVSSVSVVASEEHRFIVKEQMRELGLETASIILEPIGLNTAPALTLAALSAVEDEDAIMVVMPADHVLDENSFVSTIQAAIHEAAENAIVVFGVKPDRPETGYGYIKVDKSKTNVASSYVVEDFVEKPDVVTAQKYIKEDGFFWNAGIFVLKASVWLEAIGYYRADILNSVRASWVLRETENGFLRPSAAEFARVSAQSIDCAVMERCCKNDEFAVKMLRLDADWNDLGSWESIWRVLQKDASGNAQIGDVVATGCGDTFVYANSRLVSLVGVKDLVVVETPDAVLVANKGSSQEVKNIVDLLQRQGRDEPTQNRKVIRPWGWYDEIDSGKGFKVKRIMVNPNASISLQKHCFRAEHWVVVSGVAEIVNGSDVMTLSKNQSTYIPCGVVHRLANPRSEPLEIIEVQSGDYLEEDDIVRVEDMYGRSTR